MKPCCEAISKTRFVCPAAIVVSIESYQLTKMSLDLRRCWGLKPRLLLLRMTFRPYSSRMQ